MNILMISFTSLIQELYHGKPREIAKFPDVKLTVLVAPYWKELWSSEKRKLEVHTADTYTIEVGSTFFTGNLHCSIFGRKIGQLLKKLQPDVIDIEDEPFNAGSAHIVFLRNRLSPKSRIIIHASQSVFKNYPPPFNFFERYSLNNVDAVMARNQDAKDVLREKGYEGRIEVITHGVDPTLFINSKTEARASLGITDGFVVGYIGALVPQKGLDTLLRAVSTLECGLLLVGDGSGKPALVKLAKELELGSKLKILPPVPHRDVPKYLSAVDLVVLPSRTWANWREKFGRVLIEAMAAGVPLIGSDSGEIPAVIGDAGMIFHEGEVSELKSRIKFLMDNASERTALSLKGRERVKKFYSWEVIAKKTYELYQYVLGHS